MVNLKIPPWKITFLEGFLLGGVKRKSIAQMEKAQRLREEREKLAARKKGKTVVEKKVLGVGLPSLDDKNLLSELGKMKVLTPASLASTYGVRVSFAKDFLEELEKRRMVKLVSGCGRIKIYKPEVQAA